MKTTDKDFSGRLQSCINYVYSISFRFCADAHMAEDLAQKTLLSAWEKRGQLRELDKMTGWLRQICLNHYLSDQRKNGRIIQPEDGFEDDYQDTAPLPEQELAVDESVRELQDGCFTAMASRLSLPQKTAFILVDMLGLTITEASDLLELSVSSVKSLLFRARSGLNAFFGHHCQWVLPENSCRCLAWQEFSARREQLREEVRRHGGAPDLSDPKYAEKSDTKTMDTVIGLFRTLPERKPDESWYESTALMVGTMLQKEKNI
ncbi:MAG: RNA polymerase sigma factor [Spirochaetales bacterium]|nr:RNA polymerase sigma factor [Spirochaetales bacterium]